MVFQNSCAPSILPPVVCGADTLKILDELMEKVGEDENHPLTSLMEALGVLIENYENQNFPEVPSDPVGVLHFLMKEHGLKQGDLSEIGSQGVVSELLKSPALRGCRRINNFTERVVGFLI